VDEYSVPVVPVSASGLTHSRRRPVVPQSSNTWPPRSMKLLLNTESSSTARRGVVAATSLSAARSLIVTAVLPVTVTCAAMSMR
jgi:hypothetical protein